MREQFRVLRRTLDAEGLLFRVLPGGKHPRVVVEAHGRVIAVPIAFSPRDLLTAEVNTEKQVIKAVGKTAECEGVVP